MESISWFDECGRWMYRSLKLTRQARAASNLDARTSVKGNLDFTPSMFLASTHEFNLRCSNPCICDNSMLDILNDSFLISQCSLSSTCPEESETLPDEAVHLQVIDSCSFDAFLQNLQSLL